MWGNKAQRGRGICPRPHEWLYFLNLRFLSCYPELTDPRALPRAVLPSPGTVDLGCRGPSCALQDLSDIPGVYLREAVANPLPGCGEHTRSSALAQCPLGSKSILVENQGSKRTWGGLSSVVHVECLHTSVPFSEPSNPMPFECPLSYNSSQLSFSFCSFSDLEYVALSM